MRKSISISGIGTGGMNVEGADGGTKYFCKEIKVGYSSVIVGDTVIMTFDGPEVIIDAVIKSQLQTAKDFGMEAEEIYEN